MKKTEKKDNEGTTTDGEGAPSTELGITQKFNLVIDGLKHNQDSELAQLIVQWMDYKFQSFTNPPQTDSNKEESKQAQPVDLDQYLLGISTFTFI